VKPRLGSATPESLAVSLDCGLELPGDAEKHRDDDDADGNRNGRSDE
jgi:hypothetical protein